MFVEKVKSPGLAHLSYLLGAGTQAAVVDPRRDCDVYIEMAAARGARITHVFETHRNEDLISGAPVLAARTGATVYHGPNPAEPIAYARTAHEGQAFELGGMRVEVVETPGHTDDSLSFVVKDTDFGEEPVAVFTGDALFIGDVGRTDFYPDRPRKVAAALYNSLQKLIALGDQTLIYPAHGAGSVCGSGMADREFSTIGYERRNNPRLQIDSKEAFVAAKVGEHHYQPPYFRCMERLNIDGAPPMPQAPGQAPLDPATFEQRASGAAIVDVRSTEAFLGAHLPGSLSIPEPMIPAFAGWLLDYESDLLLVGDSAGQVRTAAVHLGRIGYDRVVGWLAASMPAWAAGGRRFNTLAAVDIETVRRRQAEHAKEWCLIDVRGADEVEKGRIPGSTHIYVGEVPERLRELDRRRHFTVLCGSGARATVAASVLLKAGFENVDLFLGSMGAWTTAGERVER